MIDTVVAVIHSWQLSNVALVIIGLLLAAMIVSAVHNKDNDLEWAQFISTRNAAGKNVGDINKIGMLVGIVVSSWVVVKLGNLGKLDGTIFFVYLSFIGSVSTFAAFYRSKQDAASSVTTSTSTTSVQVAQPNLPAQ